MGSTRTLLLALLTICLAALGLAGTATPARADTTDDVVRSLDVQMNIGTDGRVHVTETYEWDFGDREGRGLRRELAQQFAWPQDSDLMRVYRYSDIAVYSPSGAPAQHWIAGDDAYLILDIGAPDDSDDIRTGVQTYELSYTIDGTLNAIRDDGEVPDQDELYWNVTGAQWDNTIEQVTTTVTGPVDITDHRCFQGLPGSDAPCEADVQGPTGTFSTGTLNSGQEQTIAVAFPPGTFTDTDPILVPREGGVVGYGAFGQQVASVTDPIMNWLRSYWPVPVVILLAAYVVGLVRRVRQGRDDHFVGLPPGTIPHAHEQRPVAPLTKQPPVAVRFTPPDSLAPAVMSRLITKTSAPHTLPATIVDLAVRGFLTVHEAKTNRRGKATDWDLELDWQATERRRELSGPEMVLLDRLFAAGPRVRLTSLRQELPKISTAIDKGVSLQADAQGLFTAPITPEQRREAAHTSAATRSRRISLAWQLPLLIVAAVIGFVGISTNALPPSAMVLGWMVVIAIGIWLLLRGVTVSTNYRRSAVGRALYDQTLGFKQYLTKAEANQIRFEEGIDVFSRYLPYAIVFGTADRWAKIFTELQEQGRVPLHTSWYVGTPGTVPDMGSIGAAIGSFTSTVAATSGSSGGSGMSGGGAGGGGGGGGGGGR